MIEDRGYEIEIVNGDKKTVISVTGDDTFDFAFLARRASTVFGGCVLLSAGLAFCAHAIHANVADFLAAGWVLLLGAVAAAHTWPTVSKHVNNIRAVVAHNRNQREA